MRRREFIAGLCAAAWPVVARAQQGDRVRRIGAIMSVAENEPEFLTRRAALLSGLRDLGWADGRNIQVDVRGLVSGDVDRIRSLVAEILATKPEVVQATSTPVVLELQRQTRVVPIVFVSTNDPVETGIVASLPHPGGNTTGLMNFESGMAGKRLQLLKEVAPTVRRVLVIVNRGNVANQNESRAIAAAAGSLEIRVTEAPVRDSGEIESAIEAIPDEPGSGLVVTAGGLTNDLRKLIFELAARHRLPTICGFRYFAVDGSLMSYGPDNHDLWHRSAMYVDRILKGDKPGDLPVQQPTKFEFVINLKTAKALGLTIPETLLATADEVIQ
jgi:putative tryptophan/tyrosine transport system substrate-binding protein